MKLDHDGPFGGYYMMPEDARMSSETDTRQINMKVCYLREFT